MSCKSMANACLDKNDVCLTFRIKHIAGKDNAAITMIKYTSQSHYSDTELTSPCTVLVMQSTGQCNTKNQLLKVFFACLFSKLIQPL